MKKLILKDNLMECPICIEESHDMYSIATKCEKKACTTCIVSYLQTNLKASYCREIACFCGCNNLIDHTKLDNLEEANILKREYKIYFRAQRNPGTIDCIKCKNIVLKLRVNNTIEFACIGCEQKYCPRCHVDHPLSVPCAIDDPSVRKWLSESSEDIDICPGCGVLVTKEGCNSVQCGKCYTNFMWKNRDTIAGATSTNVTRAWYGRDVHDFPRGAHFEFVEPRANPVNYFNPLNIPMNFIQRPNELTEDDFLQRSREIYLGRVVPFRIVDLQNYAKNHDYDLTGVKRKQSIIDSIARQIQTRRDLQRQQTN